MSDSVSVSGSEAPAVVEGRQRQSQCIPDAGIGQHDRHIVQNRRFGEDDRSLVAGIVQISTLHRAGHRGAGRAVVTRNRDLYPYKQFFLVGTGSLGVGTLQILVHVQVGEIGIGYVFAFVILAVAIDVVRHVPILELVAFGVGIVDMTVVQFEAFLAIDQHGRIGRIGL